MKLNGFKDSTEILCSYILKLSTCIQKISNNELKSVCNSIYGQIFRFDFNEILKQKDVLKQFASYLLIYQLLFYKVIIKRLTDIQTLNLLKIKNLNEINKIFNSISQDNFLSIVFDSKLLSIFIKNEIDNKILNLIKIILTKFEEFFILEENYESIGKLFQELIPIDVRKIFAAYYTTLSSSHLIANLSIESADSKVIDLACGCGNLLLAAYFRKKFLSLEDGTNFSEQKHMDFLENDIYGIDVMPFAIFSTSINLTLLSSQVLVKNLKSAIADSTSLNPGDSVKISYKHPKRLVQKSLINYDDEKNIKQPNKKKKEKNSSFKLKYYDLVIMNPPYTKNENLSKISIHGVETPYNKLLGERLFNYSSIINKRMGLFAYFILIADKYLKVGGRIAFVLPASFLRIDACKKIRDYLIKHYNIDYIVFRNDKPNFSENTAFREILFIATKKKLNDSSFSTTCCYVQLNKLSDEKNEILKLSEHIKKREVSDTFLSYDYSQQYMASTTRNWYIPIAGFNEKLKIFWNQLAENPMIINYNQIVPKKSIIRGIDSTNKKELIKFFIVDPYHFNGRDYWKFKVKSKNNITILLDSSDKEFILANYSLIPGMRSSANLKTFYIKDLNDYLIVKYDSKIKDILEKDFGDSENDLISQLSDWLKKAEKRRSRLFHIRRFDLGSPGTIHLGYYSSVPRTPTGLTWVFRDLDKDLMKLITLWNNSTIHLLQVFLNRKETRGGFMAVDSYNFESYIIINFSKLTEKQKIKGLNLFKELKDIKFPSILEQLKQDVNRIKIDNYFLKNLFPKKDFENLGSNLRKQLFDEIQNLKLLMESNR